MLIRESLPADLPSIFRIINAAAEAYRGVLPTDVWHEPYMPMDALLAEIRQGVAFWIAEDDGSMVGAMGIQDKGAVALIRHAYVAPTAQRKGVGAGLLRHIERLTDKPILIGTWAAASWAIEFYRRNGFAIVADKKREGLLRAYWSIPERQIEASIVLADKRWMNTQHSQREGDE